MRQTNTFAIPSPATVLAVFGLLLVSGCGKPGSEVSRRYGTTRDGTSRQSVNGTTVLAGLLRQQGLNVQVDRKISPRSERFQTIVWFCDPAMGCPDEEVSGWLSRWVDSQDGRKLIFIGSGYDAAEDYWEEAVQKSKGEQKRVAARERAEAMAGRATERTFDGGPSELYAPTCPWFRIETGVSEPVKAVQTDGGDKLLLAAGSVVLAGERLIPVNDPDQEVAEWYTVNSGTPLVFEVTRPFQSLSSSVVVVSNGSFLLNYGLSRTANRELAVDFLERLGPLEGPVLFVATGDLQYSETVVDNATAWSWINQAPLRNIVPHFLVLGLWYLFSRWPTLGRPRAAQLAEQPGFGRHLQAVGSLLRRATSGERTQQWLARINKPAGREKPAGLGNATTGSENPVTTD